MTPPGQTGRIITFYSYKGGTGRSMVLANVAWILASNGYRVLTIDWDLEAPGLHRYFHPFLLDRELTATEGVIDFVTRFSIMAMTPSGDKQDEEWYRPYADLSRYAVSLDWGLFPRGATLDFVPAGKQGSAYAARVNSFDWRGFYQRLDGAALLEETKRRLRADYDYILVDSRTGVSDTSGICTVDMPDLLVVCFTLNVQSIDGAAAATDSVIGLRAAESLRVFPVPMRIDPFEKDRLERARDYARGRFNLFLTSIRGEERRRYWGDVEVMYQPFYAYEEVLAIFGDRPEQTSSVLGAVERISGYITDGKVRQAVPPPDVERERILKEYGQRFLGRQLPIGAGRGGTSGSFVYISYASSDAAEFVAHLADALESGSPPIAVWLNTRDIEPGQSWDVQIAEAIRKCESVLVVITLDSIREASPITQEWTRALLYRKPIVPLLVHPDAEVPLSLADRKVIDFTGLFESAVENLQAHLAWLASPDGIAETLRLRLTDALRELGRVDTDAERDRLTHEIGELEEQSERLRPLGLRSSDGAPATQGYFRISVMADKVRARRWDGTESFEPLVLDSLDGITIRVFEDWLRQGKLATESEFKVLGSLMYRTILSGSTAELLERTIASLPREQKLRVDLIFDRQATSHLAALPWEYLYVPDRPDREGFFFATDPRVVLSRVITQERRRPSKPLITPLRILLVVLRSEGMDGLDEAPLGEVAQGLVEELGPSIVAWEILADAEIVELSDALRRFRPDVLHLVSSFHHDSATNRIALSRPHGTAYLVSERDFVDLLTEDSIPRLVVLNGTSDAHSFGAGGFSSLASSLIHVGVEAVVTLEGSIASQGTALFIRTLYQELLLGTPVDMAVQRGRRWLYLEESRRAMFGGPVLYVSRSEGLRLVQPSDPLVERA